jgi:hypothetical protein
MKYTMNQSDRLKLHNLILLLVYLKLVNWLDIQSNLSYVTFYRNIEIGSQKTGGRLIQG